MSGGALFSNNAVRGATKNLVELKAGKMTVKGKMVYPDNRKGLLYIYQSDDSLMHFCWKDRTSGVVEDDLIIFPDDCEFKHVNQCKTGRVYLLKFKLSNKKFFFWLQDIKTDKDEEHCRKINELLNNPPTAMSQRSGGPNPEGDLQNLLNTMSQQQLMQLFGGVGQMGLGSLLGTMRDRSHSTRTSSNNSSNSTTTAAATTTASTTTTTSGSTPVTTTATRPPAAQTPAPTAVSESARSASGASKNSSSKSGAEPVAQRGVATELTNSLPGAITASESLELRMSKHLPPGDSLSTTISSPQFSQALSMFWSALQSGQAGPVVTQFGLGSDAVNAAATGNLEQFVTALETEVKSDDQLTASTTTTTSTTPANPTSKTDDKDDEMALD